MNDYFNDRFNMSGNCMVWSGYKNPGGYGQATLGGKRVLAHRMSFAVHKGDIPKGMMVLHACDNPGCINPDHLFLGTAKDNDSDCRMKGRQTKTNGSFNGRSKITEELAIAIRQLPKKNQRLLAQKYGVTQKVIWNVQNGKSWTTAI